MASLNFAYFLTIAYSLFFFPADGAVTASAPVIKGGYYPSWAFDYFPPSAVDTSLFTHIIYAFLVPSSITFRFDISNDTATRLSNFTMTIHRKNPHVKALYSIGGGESKSDPFTAMAANASSRGVFIRETIEVARRCGFDGVDLDWEYPGSPKEMSDFGFLLEEWRHAIQMEANITKRPPLLLSASVFYSVDFSALGGGPRSYPVASIKNNLDWINVMCYEYHGSWDTSETGAHAALFDPNTNLSLVYGLKSWLKAGVPQNKVILGLPLYGKTWQLKDSKVHGVGAAAVDVGVGGGVLYFSQVVEFNRRANATIAYDLDTASVYSYSGINWVGYDDPLTTTVKIGFAQALGLRGYCFWALSYDYEWTISLQASRSWIVTNETGASLF